MISIYDLKTGEKAKIIGFKQQSSAYRQQLLSMGLIPGTEFTLLRIAPLGDPIQILVRNFCLILRKKEAAVLLIEKTQT